jgi:hypothetical protein
MSSTRPHIQQDIGLVSIARFDHLIFLFAVVLGATTILFLKSGLVTIPHADMLGIVTPVILMGLYACAVTLMPRTRLRFDQAGDNLYYLGFVYTLCSLAITLYRFHTTEEAADYIVSNFGIALATTIVGVVFRVWLHQMREDPLELEQEARFEITEAIGRLRAQIDQAIREFNYFSRTLQQSAQEAIEAQGQVALQSLDNSTKQYAEVTVRALGYLEGCFTDFQRQATELNTNSGRIAAALITLSARIEGIDTPKDLLLVKLAPIFQRMADAAEETVGRVTSERQRNQGMVKLTARLEALTNSIDGIFEKAAHKDEHLTTAIDQVMLVSAHTAELAQQVRQWTERFTEIEAKQTEIVTVLAQASDVARERDHERDDAFRRTLDGAVRAIAEYEARTRTLLKTHSELFEAELQRAEKAFMALSNTLSEGASLLASELGRREQT